MTASEMDLLGINTIRTLAIDAIQKAKSGHPGTPMGIAPVAYGLWQKRLNFDPADPIWPNRDRFILSAGHASMLLYALLHLTRTQAVNADYQPLDRPSVTLDDIKAFRQLDSACPGHPEGYCQPRFLGTGRERHCAAPALADRRRGRSGALH